MVMLALIERITASKNLASAECAGTTLQLTELAAYILVPDTTAHPHRSEESMYRWVRAVLAAQGGSTQYYAGGFKGFA